MAIELINYADIKSKPVRWVWPGRLAIGHITSLNGDPGSYKSFAGIDLCARIQTGRSFPDGSPNPLPPSSTIFLTNEDGHEDTVKPRLIAAGGDPRKMLTIKGNALKLESHTDMAELAQKMPADTRLMVLDPFLDFIRAEKNNNEDRIREILINLKKFCEDHDLMVGNVNHLNKKEGLAAIHRVMGAKGLIGVPRLNFLFARDSENRVHMTSLKNNLFRIDGSLKVHIENTTVRDGDVVIENVGRLVWDGNGHMNADDLTTAKKRKGPTEDACGIWLNEFLPIGEQKLAEEIYIAGKALGFSVDKIKRRFFKLGAENGRTSETPSKSFWYRPASENGNHSDNLYNSLKV